MTSPATPRRPEPRIIPQEYGGIRYRSTREARWAVFLDIARIPAEYEPEGYDLGPAGWYRPDFRVNPDTPSELFFEVKGKTPSARELAKAEALHLQTGIPMFVYYAQVQLPAPDLAHLDLDGFWGMIEAEIGGRGFAPTAYRSVRSRDGRGFSNPGPFWWTDCPYCGLVTLESYGQAGWCQSLSRDDVPAEFPRFAHATNRLRDAYAAARAYRFGR